MINQIIVKDNHIWRKTQHVVQVTGKIMLMDKVGGCLLSADFESV